jgi:hypothetical protein
MPVAALRNPAERDHPSCDVNSPDKADPAAAAVVRNILKGRQNGSIVSLYCWQDGRRLHTGSAPVTMAEPVG